MSFYVVTGAGTDVGKTFAACALLHGAHAAGRAARGFKPVASGVSRAAEGDVAQLLEACDKAVTEANAEAINPWRFPAALSPNMADESKALDFDALVSWSRAQITGEGLRLMEGVGGAMVPLDDSHTTRDWMVALGAPVIVVTGSYLGALSHTLTAIDALRELRIAALIICESEGSAVPLSSTADTLKRFARDIPLIVAQPRVSSWREATELHRLGRELE
ncbi:MAG: dethiobiotin synthase [Alphaproteobacteria bacterium]